MKARNISNADDLYQVLADSQLFSRLERTSSDTVTVCYDSEDHTVVRTSAVQDIMCYADENNYVPVSTAGTITHAYLCSSGVILTKYYSGSLRLIFVLTKTNTGAVTMAVVDASNNCWNAVTWGDVTPLNSKYMTSEHSNQYALMPFVTNAALGVDSYMPDAFYSVVNTGNMLPRSFMMHDERWFAVGNAVLRDNPEFES